MRFRPKNKQTQIQNQPKLTNYKPSPKFARKEKTQQQFMDTDKNLSISEDSTDTFTGDSAFDKAVVERLFELTVDVRHVSGPKKPQEFSRRNMRSTYRRYTKKDEVWKNLSAEEKQMIQVKHRAIDELYRRADVKRLGDARRGSIPKHRSIDKHYSQEIKKNKLTPDTKRIQEIKGEKKHGAKKPKQKPPQPLPKIVKGQSMNQKKKNKNKKFLFL